LISFCLDFVLSERPGPAPTSGISGCVEPMPKSCRLFPGWKRARSCSAISLRPRRPGVRCTSASALIAMSGVPQLTHRTNGDRARKAFAAITTTCLPLKPIAARLCLLCWHHCGGMWRHSADGPATPSILLFWIFCCAQNLLAGDVGRRLLGEICAMPGRYPTWAPKALQSRGSPTPSQYRARPLRRRGGG